MSIQRRIVVPHACKIFPSSTFSLLLKLEVNLQEVSGTLLRVPTRLLPLYRVRVEKERDEESRWVMTLPRMNVVKKGKPLINNSHVSLPLAAG